MFQPWITCQLGHREAFAIPRALHRAGRLKLVVTDAWTPPGTPLADLLDAHGGSDRATWFGGRFEPELAGARVVSFSEQALAFEAGMRHRRLSGWDRILARNAWFQSRAAGALDSRLDAGDTVFAYSYAAREVLALARSRGCRTVLGQIDAGPHEEEIVAREVAGHSGVDTGFRRAPARYWKDWAEECALADVIDVNSHWCKRSIVAAGVAAEKIRIVPLAFEPHPANAARPRPAPRRFSSERPLRVLFLGQVIARKGIFRVIDAADRLVGQPVEITIVGEASPSLAGLLTARKNIRYEGMVARARTRDYYRDADVFLLPTLSDGFALTLLEAAAAGLPVITSEHCGVVIDHDRGGMILPEVTGAAIAAALLEVLAQPSHLERWRADLPGISSRFSIDRLSARLLGV
jgi:glycosyltransferase involved in cell wall biosynthesis